MNQIPTSIDELIGKEEIDAFVSTAFGIAVTVIVAFVLLRLQRTVIQNLVRRMLEHDGRPAGRELTQKAQTLASVIESGGRMIILIIAGMMVLSNLGVDIAPLIASAGVVGIAIGLGAQSLIRDLIGGFFILFEDQYGVGDIISVNGVTGLVEHLSLRRTSLRALDGSFIVVPNGEMRIITNMTKDWSRALIDVDISYDDDVDRAIEVLKETLEGIEQDPEIGSQILGPAEILGVEALGQYQVTIRILVKTQPMQQWAIQRELRRRIKRAFEEKGITIPYPHNVTVIRAEGAENQEAAAALLTQRKANEARRADEAG